MIRFIVPRRTRMSERDNGEQYRNPDVQMAHRAKSGCSSLPTRSPFLWGLVNVMGKAEIGIGSLGLRPASSRYGKKILKIWASTPDDVFASCDVMGSSYHQWGWGTQDVPPRSDSDNRSVSCSADWSQHQIVSKGGRSHHFYTACDCFRRPSSGTDLNRADESQDRSHSERSLGKHR